MAGLQTFFKLSEQNSDVLRTAGLGAQHLWEFEHRIVKHRKWNNLKLNSHKKVFENQVFTLDIWLVNNFLNTQTF